MKSSVASLLKVIGIVILCSIGVVLLVKLLNPARLNPPVKSDFVQDYFLARAVISGINPYLPLNELGERFGVPDEILHSSTHPPSFAVLCLPFGLLSFQHAAFLWLIVGLISLLISLRLLFELRVAALPVIFVAAIPWPPIWFDLSLGQLMLPQLLLLTFAGRALRARRDVIGGILLGLTVSIKLIVWPLLLLLLFKRKYRALLAAAGVVAFMNLIALLLIGADPVFTFYLSNARQIASIYSNNALNVSAWTIGARLFAGTTTVDAAWFHTSPLVNVPALVFVTSLICVGGIFVYAFLVAFKAKDFDTSFAVLINMSVIVSPVTWIFYLTLTLVSIAKLRAAADGKTYGIIGLAVLAPIIYLGVLPILGSYSSFAIALLMLVPLVAVLMLIGAHNRQEAKAYSPNSA